MHYAKISTKKDERKVCAEKNTSLSCFLFLLRWSQSKYAVHLQRINIQIPVVIFILFLLCLQGMWCCSECILRRSEVKWVPNVIRQNFQIKLIACSILLDSEEWAMLLLAGTGVVAEQNSYKLHIQFIYWSYKKGQKPLAVTRKLVPVWWWGWSWFCASLFHLQDMSKTLFPQFCLTWWKEPLISTCVSLDLKGILRDLYQGTEMLKCFETIVALLYAVKISVSLSMKC